MENYITQNKIFIDPNFLYFLDFVKLEIKHTLNQKVTITLYIIFNNIKCLKKKSNENKWKKTKLITTVAFVCSEDLAIIFVDWWSAFCSCIEYWSPHVIIFFKKHENFIIWLTLNQQTNLI